VHDIEPDIMSAGYFIDGDAPRTIEQLTEMLEDAGYTPHMIKEILNRLDLGESVQVEDIYEEEEW